MMALKLDFNEAADWLRDRLGMRLEPINLTFKRADA